MFQTRVHDPWIDFLKHLPTKQLFSKCHILHITSYFHLRIICYFIILLSAEECVTDCTTFALLSPK